VFRHISDFEAFERYGLRQGADITRIDALKGPGAGMLWDARVPIRGKLRKIQCELTDYDPPTGLRFDATSDGFAGVFTIELVALSLKRTRIGTQLEVLPKTLSARLMLQSARLAKSSLTRRFRTRIRNFAIEIEDRFRRSA
jgi:hypothetical protein